MAPGRAHSTRRDAANPGTHNLAQRGRMRGLHAVSVSGSWRVTFRFEDGNAVDVDYLDYH